MPLTSCVVAARASSASFLSDILRPDELIMSPLAFRNKALKRGLDRSEGSEANLASIALTRRSLVAVFGSGASIADATY